MKTIKELEIMQKQEIHFRSKYKRSPRRESYIKALKDVKKLIDELDDEGIIDTPELKQKIEG